MIRAARILVVDDNETLRTLVAQALESEGYVAIAADSGEAALEVARFAPPDLCVVDYIMPGMNGADLVRALRASTDERLRRVPAIGLSGYAEAERAMLEAGATAWMRKPVAYGPLLEHVGRMLAPQLLSVQELLE